MSTPRPTIGIPLLSQSALTAGVAHSVDELFRAHAADVSRWAARLLGPAGGSGDVEDVLSEVFLVVQRRLSGFRGEAKVTTWLYAITLRVASDYRRKQRWARWLPFLRSDTAVSPEPSPHDALESRRSLDLTYAILDRMPEAERSALILFELEGKSGEEVAAITGDSLGTIWVRLHRARSRFRKAFAAAETDGPVPVPILVSERRSVRGPLK